MKNSLRFLSLLLPAVLATQAHAGRIVVNNDEWTFTDSGFAIAPDTGRFAQNVASWFTKGAPGRFLAYSPNFGIAGGSLANAMRSSGHSWTVSTSVPFTIETLRQYDGVFLAGYPADNAVLAQYVREGGNVYVAAGTGYGGAPVEAGLWNPFLTQFGLQYGSYYNGIGCGGALPSGGSHPIQAGINSLYYCNGNTVSKTDPADPRSSIVLSYPDGQGMIGVAEVSSKAHVTQCNLDGYTNQLSVMAGGYVTADDGVITSAYFTVNHGPRIAVTPTGSGGTVAKIPLALVDGRNVIDLVAVDSDGVAASARQVVIVDRVPPVIIINSPTPDQTVDSTSVTVNATIQDSSPTLVSVNWAWQPVLESGSGTIVTTTTVLPDGSTEIWVTATDAADNTSEASVTVYGNAAP